MDVTEDFRLERICTASATKSRKVKNECTKQAVQKKWSKIVSTKLGFQDYNAFRDASKTGNLINLCMKSTNAKCENYLFYNSDKQ